MCDHNTTTVIYSGKETSVEFCDWGCDQILIYKIMPDGTTQLVREVEPKETWHNAEILQLTTDLLETRRALAMEKSFSNELSYTISTMKIGVEGLFSLLRECLPYVKDMVGISSGARILEAEIMELLEVKKVCPECAGSGKTGSIGLPHECPYCQGTGKK